MKSRSIQPCHVNKIEPSSELEQSQFLMPISREDRENLKKDISDSGEIRDPLKVYRDGAKFKILCGYNRWLIAQELGMDLVPIEIYDISEKERLDLVIKDNLNRRHLSTQQKQKLIEYFLKADPYESDRTIAKKTGTHHSTVSEKRKQMASGGEISQVNKIKGTDGKLYKKSESAQKNSGGEISHLRSNIPLKTGINKKEEPKKPQPLELRPKIKSELENYLNSFTDRKEKILIKEKLLSFIKKL